MTGTSTDYLATMNLVIRPPKAYFQLSEADRGVILADYKEEALVPDAAVEAAIRKWVRFPLQLPAGRMDFPEAVVREIVTKRLRPYNRNVRAGRPWVVLPPISGGPQYDYLNHVEYVYLRIPQGGLVCLCQFQAFLDLGGGAPAAMEAWRLQSHGIVATVWLTLHVEAA